MPIYEYVCRGCDNEFEEFLKSRDEHVACPSCGTDDISRRISIVGFKSGPADGGGGGCGSCGGGSCGSCGCG